MRLIDADEVRLQKGFFEKVTNVPKFYEWLDSLPTVDAEPVVRCKDCVYWDDWEDERSKGWRYCAMIDTKTEGSWFCADGEKKDGKHDSTD